MDDPPPPAILASDQDRDQGIERLSTAVSEGRLPLEEFSDRVGLAQTAWTQEDLAAVTRDLPAQAPGAAVVASPRRRLAFCSRLVRSGSERAEAVPEDVRNPGTTSSPRFGRVRARWTPYRSHRPRDRCTRSARRSGHRRRERDSGRIGPKLHTTGNGRRLIAPGQFVSLGHFPTGGALTADGRFYWTVSTGRAQNDVRIVNVALKHPRVIQSLPLPGASGGITIDGAQVARMCRESRTRQMPTRCERTFAAAAAT